MLMILSLLTIGENSIVFVPYSTTFGISVDSVVFCSSPSMICSGVSRSISVTGIFFWLFCFSSVFCSLLLLLLTMLTETFLLINLGIVDVCLRCVDSWFWFCLCPTPIRSGNDTLVLFMMLIYNSVYAQVLMYKRSQSIRKRPIILYIQTF